MARVITEEIIRNYEVYLLKEEKSQTTMEKYLRDIRHFDRFLSGREVTKEVVIEYKKMLLGNGYAVSSANSMLAALNGFLQFQGWQDCRVKHIKKQRQTYCTEENELTKAEYLRLLNAAKNQEWMYLILQTICSTGIRISELKYFTVEGILQGEIMVNLKNKSRIILVPAKLKRELLKFAKKEKICKGPIFVTRSGKPYDRSYIWSRMKRLSEAANVKWGKIFPHNLRKLFARSFYSLERDIAKLADILGHSSIETTRIYIMTTGAEHRRKLDLLGLVI